MEKQEILGELLLAKSLLEEFELADDNDYFEQVGLRIEILDLIDTINYKVREVTDVEVTTICDRVNNFIVRISEQNMHSL